MPQNMKLHMKNLKFHVLPVNILYMNKIARIIDEKAGNQRYRLSEDITVLPLNEVSADWKYPRRV